MVTRVQCSTKKDTEVEIIKEAFSLPQCTSTASLASGGVRNRMIFYSYSSSGGVCFMFVMEPCKIKDLLGCERLQQTHNT